MRKSAPSPRPSPSEGARRQRLNSERGAALLLVLWVAAFFGIALSAFAFSMRTELVAARNFKERAVAEVLARAGVARAAAELVNAGRREGEHSAAFRPYSSGDVPLGRGTYRVVVTDEESRIALNRAPAEALGRLLRNTGVRDSRLRDTIVDSILDWRDEDDLHHVSGAEDAYYRSLSPPYRPRNGPFHVLDELLLVKGMTRDILEGNLRDADRLAALRRRSPEDRDLQPGEYLGIRPFLTVHGSGQVNPNTASLDVLVAVGLAAPEAKAIVRDREHAPIGGRLGRPSKRVSWTLAPRSFRIESIGRVRAASVAYRIAATVLNEGAPGRLRLRIVAWQEGLG